MALGLVVAADIASAALTYFVRGPALAQTTQNKPLLKALRGSQKSFPGGKDNISTPVQGAFMSDTVGFFAGYSEDDILAFAQAANILRASFPWKELHAGLIISWTELKKDGVTVVDSGRTSDHTRAELTRLTSILSNRLADYGESWSRSLNDMLWRDGSQDAKAMPGMLSILTDVNNVGTTGGLDKATYPWWRQIIKLNVQVSPSDQTLSQELRRQLIQLRRYGGRPNRAFCGADFIDALQKEVQAKGIYTQEGFKSEGKTDLGMASIRLMDLGTFEYDPTLDSLGLSKRCYIYDDRHIQLQPMEGEDNKVLKPERPYNYAVFLQSMTWTGGLIANQLNCNAVFSVA